jgi:CARDB
MALRVIALTLSRPTTIASSRGPRPGSRHRPSGWVLGILTSVVLVAGGSAHGSTFGTPTVTISNAVARGDSRFVVAVGRAGETDFAAIDGPEGSSLRNIMLELNHYVDVGAAGGAVQLGATTIVQEPRLTGPNQVTSRGSFIGNALNTINWTAVSTIAPGSLTYETSLTFSSNQPFSTVRLIQYADMDVGDPDANELVAIKTFNQPNFELVIAQRSNPGVGLRIPQPTVVSNATCAGWAARPFPQLREAITGSGATYDPSGRVVGIGSTTDSRFQNFPVFGPANVTAAIACDLNPTATSATIVFRVTATTDLFFFVTVFQYVLSNTGDVAVAPGQSATVPITATLKSNAMGEIRFSAAGQPVRDGATFAPDRCTPSPLCTVLLTITTSSSPPTPAGPYPITVTGSSSSDRTTGFTLNVQQTAAPDLIVTRLTAPTTGIIGGILNGVSVEARNQGNAVVNSDRVGFYFSTDQTITSSDVFSGSCTVGPLGPGATQSCDVPITVPESLSPGTYELGAFVDDQPPGVTEINEQNNVRSADTGSIVLGRVSLSLNQTTFGAGSSLRLAMTIPPGLPTANADVFLVLVLPDGSAYCHNGATFVLIYDRIRLLPGTLRPFRANFAVAPISQPINQMILQAVIPAAIPRGGYSFMMVLVEPGKDPLVTQWLAPASRVGFTIP